MHSGFASGDHGGLGPKLAAQLGHTVVLGPAAFGCWLGRHLIDDGIGHRSASSLQKQNPGLQIETVDWT